MYLFRFIVFWCFFLVLLISGIVSLNSMISISEIIEWIQQNWVIALLALVGSIMLLWIGRKLLKGMIIIAGAGLTMNYALTYEPGIYEIMEPFGVFSFVLFVILLLPLMSEPVRDLLSGWNDELEYRAKSKFKSKKKKAATKQKTSIRSANPISNARSFEIYVTQMEHHAIQEVALTKYNHFAKHYGNVGFGESGANEFVAATLFAKYRPAFGKYINDGIEQVFKHQFSPLQFSDYMDEIINRSDIPYVSWSAVYNYLKNNVQWIKSHEVSGNQSVISPAVSEAIGRTYLTSKPHYQSKRVYQVVGVTFDNRQSVIKRLQKGDSLFLVLEPTNPHDKNAIHVMNPSNQSVGYISKKENQELIRSFNGKNSMRAWVDQVYSGSSKADYFGVQIRIDNIPQSQAYSGSSTNRTDTYYSTSYDDDNPGSLDWDDFDEDGVPYRNLHDNRYH